MLLDLQIEVIMYSKALRCTFFGEWNNSCISKFVQLENLIFLDPIQKRAVSRSVQLEAVYLEALLYVDKKILDTKHK